MENKEPKPRRSPRKRTILNYKDFVGGLEGTEKAELSSPKRKKTRAPLKGPSRTRMAAQKKIRAARTRRLCSPPPSTRVISAPTTPLSVPDLHEQVTTDETEAAQTLLSLSMDNTQPTTDEATAPASINEAEIESANNNQRTVQNESEKPSVALEVNVIINPSDNKTAVLPGKIIGIAIKEETKTVVKQPSDKTRPKKKTNFRMKSYSLKRKPDVKRKFKCRICPEILDSVHKYNYHYREKHPALPCPHCTRTFTSPRYLSRHMYTHAEIMYECTICAKGFTFESQFVAHKRRHIKDTGFKCMKNNCGKSFKRDSELKAHVKTHRKTSIKCGHGDCSYSNKDIRSVRAHKKRHADNKPYKCPNCTATFKWQEQKKRHLIKCK